MVKASMEMSSARCSFCNYVWVARVAIPKECPDCKRRWPVGRPEEVVVDDQA
jgi:predicted Zn-ribbon and HTH transcriptional regulator